MRLAFDPPALVSTRLLIRAPAIALAKVAIAGKRPGCIEADRGRGHDDDKCATDLSPRVDREGSGFDDRLDEEQA
jgi:hypothetical protein